MAAEFSRNSMDGFRRQNKPLRCKECISKAQQAEIISRVEIVSHSCFDLSPKEKEDDESSSKIGKEERSERVQCSQCFLELHFDAFNKTQLRKGENKRRCKDCVTLAGTAEKTAVTYAKAAKMKAAQERVANAEKCGSAAEQLQAAAALSALQAEMVTGLKPVKLLRMKKRK